MEAIPSKKQVQRAGSRLRKYLSDPQLLSDADFQDDLDIVRAHRRAHYAPMNVASVALRGYCSRLGFDAVVSQRLKRMETILDKLMRQPNMDLSTMQDLGGCRVVVGTIPELRALQQRLQSNHPDARVSDYVSQPRASGYRAVHVVAPWGGSPRKPVEIQLRTYSMHLWADMVERVSGLMGINYKQDGHEDFQLWALSFSRILDLIERGIPVPSALEDEQEQALRTVMTQLERSRS